MNPYTDEAELQRLVQLALVEIQQEDWTGRVPSLRTLQRCANQQVFEVVKKLCQSPVAHERSLGAIILGEFGYYESDKIGYHPVIRVFVEESADLLIGLLEHDTDPEVLDSAATALGHMQEPRGVEALIKHKAHPSDEVRFGVVFGLLGQEDERAIQALIELSQDPDDDVRDWATFGLGTQIEEIDTPEIRAALWKNIDDPHQDTRYEALEGLARRRDRRILPRIMDELEADIVAFDSYIGDIFCEMLEALKDEISDSRLATLLEGCRNASNG